jgi:DNA (cytosine-5)-methyltransferase 1
MPRLLDLFCCQGGAGMGYSKAGFEVVGVDIEPQRHYPFEFIQADALEFLDNLERYMEASRRPFDAIHASPPCQLFTKAQRIQGNDHLDLLTPTRERLERIGLPYVIENVEEARSMMRDPVMLCGTMFGLRLYRHRLFECNWQLTEPLHGQHFLRQVKMGRKPGEQEILQPVGNYSGAAEAREAMQMPWATRDGIREAIPPAYTEYIGRCLKPELQSTSPRRMVPDEQSKLGGAGVSYLSKMRPPPEVGARPHINVLLYGPGKSGKTTAALSAPDFKLALNFDQVNSTYFARTFRDPGHTIFEIEMPRYEEGKLHTENMLNEVAVTYARHMEDGSEPDAMTVIADPIGQLHRRLLEDLSRKAIRPSRDAYGDVAKIIERWARFMCDMPCNFVMVCHERPIKDEESGGFERLPFTGTTNPDLGLRLAEMVDIVGYTGRLDQEGETKYVAQLFNGNGRRGGDRFGVLGDYRELDLAEWFDVIGGATLATTNNETEKAA